MEWFCCVCENKMPPEYKFTRCVSCLPTWLEEQREYLKTCLTTTEWQAKKRAENEEFRKNIDKEFTSIIETFEKLMKELEGDVSNIPIFRHENNIEMREDIVTPSLTREQALAGAPDKFDGYFRVPCAIPKG